MNNQLKKIEMKLTKEQRKRMKKVLTDLESDYGHQFFTDEIPSILNELEAAINFTDSSMELKEKEVPTFDEWLKIWNWKQIGSSYTFKRGESFTDAESLLKSYTKEYNL